MVLTYQYFNLTYQLLLSTFSIFDKKILLLGVTLKQQYSAFYLKVLNKNFSISSNGIFVMSSYKSI